MWQMILEKQQKRDTFLKGMFMLLKMAPKMDENWAIIGLSAKLKNTNFGLYLLRFREVGLPKADAFL